MKTPAPDDYFRYPLSGDFQREFVAFCVNEHGDRLLSAVAVLEQPADPDALLPVVARWLGDPSGGQDGRIEIRPNRECAGVIPDIWCRFTQVERALRPNEEGRPDEDQEEAEDPSEAADIDPDPEAPLELEGEAADAPRLERQRNTLLSQTSSPRWLAMLMLLSDVPPEDAKKIAPSHRPQCTEGLIEHLIGDVDNRHGGLRSIEIAADYWRRGKREPARRILGHQLERYFWWQAKRIQGPSVNRQENLIKVEKAMRRFAEEEIERRGLSGQGYDTGVRGALRWVSDERELADLLANQAWEGEFSVSGLEPMKRVRKLRKQQAEGMPVRDREKQNAIHLLAASLVDLIAEAIADVQPVKTGGNRSSDSEGAEETPWEEQLESLRQNARHDPSRYDPSRDDVAWAEYFECMRNNDLFDCINKALNEEERAVVFYEYQLGHSKVQFASQRAFCRQHDISRHRFRASLEKALKKLKACLAHLDDGADA